MTTYTEKVLAEGQLPLAKTTLYTATGVRVNVRVSKVSNIAAGDGILVLLYYKKATSRQIMRVVLDNNEWAEDDAIFQMDSGDIIEGYASGNNIDYLITGVTVA